MKKNNRKNLYIIIIFLVLFSPICYLLVPQVVTKESFYPKTSGFISEPIIDHTALKVDVDNNFVDNEDKDYTRHIRSVSGITGLRSFENLGQSTEDSDIDNGVIAYKAKAVFEFETVAWTKLTVNDMFPTLWDAEDSGYSFFQVIEVPAYPLIMLPFTINTYAVRWSNLDIENFNQHRYDGYFSTNLHIDPGFYFSGGIELGGVQFETPTLKAEIIDVHIEDSYSKDLGRYSDKYVDTSGVSEGYVDFTIIDETDAIGAQMEEVVDWLNEQNIGWKAGDIIEGISYQQGLRSPDPDGTYLADKISNDESTYSNIWTSYMHYDLQPEVTKATQINKVIIAGIWYSRPALLSPYIDVSVHPTEYICPERVVGVHVYNQMIHYNCLAEVNFIMTIETEGELSESFLADPNLYLSDMVWDTSFMGNSIVHIIFQPSQFPLGDIIGIIIFLIVFAVCVYVFLKIGIPVVKGIGKYLRRK